MKQDLYQILILSALLSSSTSFPHTTCTSNSNASYKAAAPSTKQKLVLSKTKSKNNRRTKCDQHLCDAGIINTFSTSTNLQAASTGTHLPYESTIQVLRKYHAIYGNLVIPRRYRVPPTQDFPTEWHNLHLSSTVYNMKWWSTNVASKPERVFELNQLEFVWERLQPEYNLVLEALFHYKSIHGHVQVPASFVVPHDTEERKEWPMATWGIPLGNCVYRIRSRGDFLAVMRRLGRGGGSWIIWVLFGM